MNLFVFDYLWIYRKHIDILLYIQLTERIPVVGATLTFMVSKHRRKEILLSRIPNAIYGGRLSYSLFGKVVPQLA